jgi:transcriptional regulator with XRE-family HTH domain
VVTTTVTPAGHAAHHAAQRRGELREFLMSRRARISPAEAGLPSGPRRRTPGLRREEVAVLAGVGVSWYQWLEQGRAITVSPQVLDAVARTLQLDEAERRHLYLLAGLNPPLPALAPDRQVNAGLLRLVDGLMPMPVIVQDLYWDNVADNEAARLVFNMTGSKEHNGLVCFFTHSAFRSCLVGWAEAAASLVAQYRAEMTAHAGDEGFAAVVERLTGLSPEFAELWARHDVTPGGFVTKTFDHPRVGRLEFEITQLRVPERPDLTVVLDNPAAGSDTAAKIEQLLAENRHGMHMAEAAG